MDAWSHDLAEVRHTQVRDSIRYLQAYHLRIQRMVIP